MAKELKTYYDTECPPCMEGFLSCWNELNERRQLDTMSGNILPLTYPEIDAWNRLTNAEVTPLGVEMISLIDREWLNSQNNNK